MEQLAKAVLAVMHEVKGIEKSMTVGSGANAYKGVPDKEVKRIIGEAMHKHGLCILPIGVEPKTQIERWEEIDQYSKETPKATKQKQSVFTEVATRYLLLHSSGESVELQGYGHGTDTQDKGAGKATTYALKYTLLYTFLTPTGTIDDADNTHSDEIPTPPAKPKDDDNKKWLNENTAQFTNAVKALKEGKTMDDIRAVYKVSKATAEALINAVKA